ncbi:hypothetical protein MMC28_005800 [Mycoblastus sanguinarius]|nr:hypothetical protein [Mycoblastus sanguinarius]
MHEKASFLSLPRELRDQNYDLLLVSQYEPIYYDKINGFMPAEKLVQSGIALMDLGYSNALIAVEAREIFYKKNTFTVKCIDIPSLLDYTPFVQTDTSVFDPMAKISRLDVLVDCAETVLVDTDEVEVSDFSDRERQNPTAGLQKLKECPNLQRVDVGIRERFYDHRYFETWYLAPGEWRN